MISVLSFVFLYWSSIFQNPDLKWNIVQQYIKTRMRLLSSVDEHVSHTNSSLTELFGAIGTTILFLSNVYQSSDSKRVWMICHIVRMDASFLQCDISSGSSDEQPIWRICCAVHIWATSLQCEWANVWLVSWKIWWTWHKRCKCVCWPCPKYQYNYPSLVDNKWEENCRHSKILSPPSLQ